MQQNENRPQRFADITPEMIQDWKAKYGEKSLRQIDVPDEEGEDEQETILGSFVVRTPSRSAYDSIMEKQQKSDYVGVVKALVTNCVLGGDLEAMEQDSRLYSCLGEELSKLLQSRKAVVKKL